MTSAEINKLVLSDMIGKKAVYFNYQTERLRIREIVSVGKNRLTVKDSKNTLENISWGCVQRIE